MENKLIESPAQAVEVEVLESTLTSVERTALGENERIIENGLKSYHDIGRALVAIRDGRLYRDLYGSFEEYCQSKFGFVRQQAYRLINAAQVADNLQTTGSIPQTESQARELAVLPAEAQRLVWDRLQQEDTPITARKIQEVASQVVPQEVQKYVEPKTKTQSNLVNSPESKTGSTADSILDQATENQRYEHIKPRVQAEDLADRPCEWDLSPQVVIDLVLEVCGEIDLDPCSNDVENPHVPATAHYASDGLAEERIWVGNIYCFPPTDQHLRRMDWVFRLRREVKSGNCRNGFLYLPLEDITRWLRPLAAYTFAVIPDQHQAMVLAYLGEQQEEFMSACQKRFFYVLGTVE